jgi:hypothetical protein
MTASDIFKFEGLDYEERRNLILNLVKSNEGLIIDKFKEKKKEFCNIYILGSSSKWVCAHYDTINDFNANDNTASVVNCLLLKQKRPSLNVAILDGEEPPVFGAGSRRLASLFHGECDFILNLELTGYGKQIRIGDHNTSLGKRLVKELGATQEQFPFSDTDIFMDNNVMSEVLILSDDLENVHNCHNSKDRYDLIKTEDMELLVKKLATFLQ